MDIKYKRVVIKLSGEALAGPGGFGIDWDVVTKVVNEIKSIHEIGVEIGIIIGGGNFWRGRQAEKSMDRTTADHMGMLATVINALALQDALEKHNVPVRVQTALEIMRVAEPYILRRALRHFEKGRVVVFACGTGNPYFTTDTGAALRACEIGANALLLAKNIDGVYTKDPRKCGDAVKLEHLSYFDVISGGLKAMDATAITMCYENNIPIIVFALAEEKCLEKAVCGMPIGTLID